jgi:small subunit ribosomal protein S5
MSRGNPSDLIESGRATTLRPRGRKKPRRYRNLTLTRDVVKVDRVSRVTKGGKRIGFRALVVVGDKTGRVGVGVASALDSYYAIEKGEARARRELLDVIMTSSGSIPHTVVAKFGAAKVLLLPAAPGCGVIAGSSIRSVLELAGIQNILSKRLGSSNLINNARATLVALAALKRPFESSES